MASNPKFYSRFILHLLLLVLLCAAVVGVSGSPRQLSDALIRKGYMSSALLLQLALPDILETYPIGNRGLTLFVPTDTYFTSSENVYPLLFRWTPNHDPHLPLLRYHAVPFKIDQNTFESSPSYSKINTLHHNLPLVITSSPADSDSGEGGRHAVYIDSVEITDWNLYNDSDYIVHGTKGFFNPGYTVIYPSLPEGPTLQYSKHVDINIHVGRRKQQPPPQVEIWDMVSFVLAALVMILLLLWRWWKRSPGHHHACSTVQKTNYSWKSTLV